MAKERMIIEKDGKKFWKTEAKITGIGIVGSAATPFAEDLADLTEVYGAKQVFDGFVTWQCTQHQNTVRGAARDGSKLKVSDVIALYQDGTLEPTEVDENAIAWQKKHGDRDKNLVAAAERMIRQDPDPNRITYFTVKKIDEIETE